MEKYSAIQEIYYGQCNSGKNIKPNKEYRERSKKRCEIEDKLKEKLKGDTEGLQLLEEMAWAHAGMEAAITEQYYREGFSFGMLLGLEVIESK